METFSTLLPRTNCISGFPRTAAAVVKLRFPEGEERSASACKNVVKRVCESMPENPYNKSSGKYTLEIVDEWLSRKVPDKEKLEKLLGIKDDKLVDEDVLKYYRERTVTIEHLARYDWELKI